MRQGVSHFERAFYQLTPHKRDAEASREFDLAISEFEGELAARPSSAEAHRYLGRIYAVRKNFAKAAAHYDRLSEIEPLNVDACVLAALAYVDNGQVAEARGRLVAGQGRTTDPDVLAKLAEYIAKLDLMKR
jgi:cytochrome c-type biogenesis protein CcmH/NrfG